MSALAEPRVISVLRARKRMTQTELGRRIGRPQGDVSLIENGRTRPRPPVMRDIADALEFQGDPNDLLLPITQAVELVR